MIRSHRFRERLPVAEFITRSKNESLVLFPRAGLRQQAARSRISRHLWASNWPDRVLKLGGSPGVQCRFPTPLDTPVHDFVKQCKIQQQVRGRVGNSEESGPK